MTVSTHEMTILCLIEMTEDTDSLAVIANAAIKRRNDIILDRKRSHWIKKLIDDIDPAFDEPVYSEHKKHLFTWSWIGGGYNQTYAHTEAEAVDYAHKMCADGPGVVLKPDMSTFKYEPNVDEYWNNIPLMD